MVELRKWIRQFDRTWVLKGMVIGSILFYVMTQFPYFYPFPETTSWLTSHFLSIFGIEALAYQHFLIVQNIPVLEISAECSGVVLLMVFPLIIFLIPDVDIRHRLGSLLFLPVLYLGNILRIAIDVWIGLTYGVDALGFFHDTLGQIFIFFWTIILYILWLHLFGNFPHEQRVIHPDGYD